MNLLYGCAFYFDPYSYMFDNAIYIIEISVQTGYTWPSYERSLNGTYFARTRNPVEEHTEITLNCSLDCKILDSSQKYQNSNTGHRFPQHIFLARNRSFSVLIIFIFIISFQCQIIIHDFIVTMNIFNY